jgi:hypothetical protein
VVAAFRHLLQPRIRIVPSFFQCMRELAHTCHPRGSDEGLKAPTLVAHWRKPLPPERGEPADAGDLDPLRVIPCGFEPHCAQPHFRLPTGRSGVVSPALGVIY